MPIYLQLCIMVKKIPNIYKILPLLENRTLLHSAFWGVVILVIVIVPPIPMPLTLYIQMLVVDISMLMILTYVTTQLLFPYLLYQGRYILFFILGFMLCCFTSFLVHHLIITFFIDFVKKYVDINLLTPWDAITIDILFFFLVTALKLTKDLMIQQHQAEQEQKQKMTQELSFLRSQLSPHFLLNTMNNLYGLSVLKSDALPRLLLRFSDLLRYSIYDTKSELVNVKSELKYLNDFIELQKMRLNNGVRLKIEIEEVNYEKAIVPMVLVVFVENAFKHSQNLQSSFQRFINIKIFTENNYLVFQSENNTGSVNPIHSELGLALDTFKIKNEGIGLETTLRRLELLYGKESLPIIEKTDQTYKVSLKLQLHDINEKN